MIRGPFSRHFSADISRSRALLYHLFFDFESHFDFAICNLLLQVSLTFAITHCELRCTAVALYVPLWLASCSVVGS